MVVTILQQGLIFGLVALGVYIAYTILDFPDITVDGTYLLGGAVAGMMLLSGINPLLACLAAFAVGCLAGTLTGCLHVFAKIDKIIAGIISMTALYSINMVIMGPNISLFGKTTIFSGINSPLGKLIIIGIIAIIIKLLLDFFMNSKMGLYLRCTGKNPELATSLGSNVGAYKIIGLALSNGLVGLAGSIMVQLQNYADSGMSQGVLVLGLTCVLLGLAFKFRDHSLGVMLGAIIFQAIIGGILYIGLPTVYLKLVMAILLVVILLIRRQRVNG